MTVSIALALLAGPGNVRKELEADYALFSRAWRQRNLEPTYKLMADDFVAIGLDRSGKTVGRKQMIENTKQLLVAKDISWPRHILRIDRHGDHAIATVDGHFTGMMPARDGGKPSKFEIIATTRDTWTYNGKSWIFKRMEMVKSKLLVNGKAAKY